MIQARMKAFDAELENLGVDGRRGLVQGARLSEKWPFDSYVKWHARKHGEGRTPEQYTAWAQAVKNRAGTEVYAYIHSIKLARGLAFVDHRENTVVWFSVEEDQNASVFHPEEGTSQFLASKPEYRRLRETEL